MHQTLLQAKQQRALNLMHSTPHRQAQQQVVVLLQQQLQS
jgi:hypothetical protein